MARTRKKPAAAPAGEGVEVTDAPVQVVARAAAIDVAKGSGMVCTRLPSDTRAGRRTQRVWQVTATFAAVVTLMDHLRSQGIERLVLESTSDYWRIWYYLAEAAGLEVWLVNARDVKHLPGRSKSDKLDCVWLCKLNEWGMLRRSFVPPGQIRDLRALTRLRTHLVHDRTRHQNRIEKILEDALLKISSVISDLMGASGRRMLAALVRGERDPRALAGLGDHRLKTTRLDGQITRLLEQIPGIRGVCTSCGLIGGGHAPACASDQARVLSVIERLDEITGVGTANAQVIIAELGTSMAQFPTPGHAAAWARLTSRTIQSGTTTKNGRTGKGSPYLRGALGAAVMTAANTDTFLGERYRRIARRRGKQKAIVAVARTICEIACLIIGDPGFRYIELGAGYYAGRDPQRQTRNKIRELEKLNPGMTVTLTPHAAATETPAA